MYTLSEKTSIYTTLVGILNAKKFDFGEEVGGGGNGVKGTGGGSGAVIMYLCVIASRYSSGGSQNCTHPEGVWQIKATGESLNFQKLAVQLSLSLSLTLSLRFGFWLTL